MHFSRLFIERPIMTTLVVFAILIAVVGVVAYANNRNCGWHFDDAPAIVGNQGESGRIFAESDEGRVSKYPAPGRKFLNHI